MSDANLNGWDTSAQAWIDDMSSEHEFGRRHVLDPVMLERVRGRGFATALDVGCGEGRFCRMMRAEGIAPIGIDPIEALIAEARARDPGGDYRLGFAEQLDVADASVDLVVSYLSLIDIPDIGAAIPQMVRVLRPGGTLLIANLNSFDTAALNNDDRVRDYLDERAEWTEWRGIRVRNWHRPLSTYMTLLLDAGLQLRLYAEPPSVSGPPARRARYQSVPWFHVMEWQKPGG